MKKAGQGGESLGEDGFFWFFLLLLLLGFSFFLLTKHIHFEPLPMLDSFLPCPPALHCEVTLP